MFTLVISPHPSFLQAKMPPRANLLANFAGLFTVPRRGRLIAALPQKNKKAKKLKKLKKLRVIPKDGFGRLPQPHPYGWVQGQPATVLR
jgi:hypothetical protein